jgi:hypothetical protein
LLCQCRTCTGGKAFKYSQAISTKRELIETALKEYVDNRKRKNIKELKGKIKFRKDYDSPIQNDAT